MNFYFSSMPSRFIFRVICGMCARCVLMDHSLSLAHRLLCSAYFHLVCILSNNRWILANLSKVVHLPVHYMFSSETETELESNDKFAFRKRSLLLQPVWKCVI
jgi:hypothetical protein